MSESPPGLRRAMRLPHATAMVVGTIIGASIFVQPSEITGRIPSVPGIAAVWIVAGLLTLCGALVCAELASIFTGSGGVYVYLRESFSPLFGFLWGWAMFWVMHTGIIAVVAMIFARYADYFLPLGPEGVRWTAVGAVAVLSVINYVGVRQGATLQTLLTAGKLIAIALILVIGFAFGAGAGMGAEGLPELPVTDPGIRDFGLALVAGLFAFGGWHMVTYSAEETVDPARTIPRALIIGTLIVTVCYLLLNAVYLYILPMETVASSTRVAADAADAVFGFGGGAVMSGLVMFSTFGALAGIILAGPRVYFAMANDGLLPRAFATVHPRFRTPHRAVVLQGVWSVVLVLTGSYRVLFTRVIYTEWIFFGLLAIGLMRLRRRPGLERGYSVWGYPAIPILFIVSAFGIAINQIASEPGDSLMGLGLVLLGVPVYYIWLRPKKGASPA